MSEAPDTSPEAAELSIDQQSLTRDTILEVLSNQRRRFAIQYLKHQQSRHTQESDAVPIGELADQIASWENNKPIDQLTAQERKRVQNALRQFHLPKMADYGFINFNSQRGRVTLTETAAKTDFYVDVLPERGIPWGAYYLGLTGICLFCLAGIVGSLYPFSLFSPLAWSGFFVTVFGVSSLGHFYDNHYRMRLGARETPPEVDEP